jgi:GNAT superfamily N-acetyltransferase
MATIADIPELIRLRKVLFSSMQSSDTEAASWQRAFADMVAVELKRSRPLIAATVVDAADGSLASCAMGSLLQRFPGPRNASGLTGYVSNVCTDPVYRRRGYSLACMTALLEWFSNERITRVELRTSSAAEPMYRSLGFARTDDPAMVVRLG